ncbi:tyrosine-type recombinase/integrase [Rhodopirellula bahusiensis]|uniref:Integrase n=1 Tax=Rhodopirellula bahusiensis TaxID=2014065 RepID=A0A2G1W5L1_9BACT|nr:tyrosine-type recombinase/integrase [Rhodopirellula bahusiensis]PHQ34324.1 integrase [Rhodopirellula bahusiensis]
MPKLSKSLPKYRKHKASGQAIVNLGGKDHYLGPHGTKTSRVEYDRLVAEWLTNGRRLANRTDETEITVVEVLAAFWKFAQGWYVKNGEPTNEVEAYRLVIRDIKRLYGNAPATEFGPIAFKAVRQVWIDRGQARSTVNKNAGRLKRLFKWAVGEELIPPSVHQALLAVDGLRKGRCQVRESDPIMPVPLEVVEATLPHLPRVTADMIRFQLLTGARPGEVCVMTPASIHRDEDVWEYRVDGHKTEHHGRSRTVFIGPDAQLILARYLLRESDEVCFSMAEAVEQRRALKASQRVTPPSSGNRRGKRSEADRRSMKRSRKLISQTTFNTGSYAHAIKYACAIAFPAPEPLGCQAGETNAARMRRLTGSQSEELKAWQKQHRWHPNQLRHTRGTEIRKQFGIEAAQVILGHAAADVTQVYAERDAEKGREVARKIG